jgi:site-specific DNA-methyltransferase (adenine-specific)
LHQVHFSSNSNEWATPRAFFDRLDAEFAFDLDPCCTPLTAKCGRYFTEDEDGLAQSWTGSVFVNPPYGRKIGRWVEKCYLSAQEGATVVLLMPVRSDTPYWHDFVMRASEVRLVRGRLRFEGGPKENSESHNAPFPCCVVVFKPFCDGPPTFCSWER